MKSIHCNVVWTALSLQCLTGCVPAVVGPTKSLQVANGGPPVLTSQEREASGAVEKTLVASRPVMAVAYEEEALEEPQRLKAFAEWTEQDAAKDALGRIGPAAVPALLQTLRDPSADVRRKGVEVLGRMGDGATAAVPELVRLLDDPDPEVRKSAARTLGRIGPAAKDAVPALMRAMFEVRREL
jgi:HEAT repeat protein